MLTFAEAGHEQPVGRRLAAILAADVEGYSRLMGADEEGTHERLKAQLCELVDPSCLEGRRPLPRGTSGSNPLPSASESEANLTSSSPGVIVPKGVV